MKTPKRCSQQHKNRIGTLLALTVAMSLTGSLARADQITIGDSQDTSIASGIDAGFDYGTANLSFAPWFLINWEGATSSQGLIQFDLSSLPSNAVIQSATLSVFHEFNDGDGDTISMFRNTAAWSESTATYDTKPSFDSTAVSSLTINDSNSGVFRTFDLTSVVQGWYSGAFVNDGLTVTQSPDAAPWIYLDGQRATDPSEAPSLTIVFSTSPVPEPSSITLCGLGLGGIFLFRYGRRRRERKRARI
jgi:PEP-CTERM motif